MIYLVSLEKLHIKHSVQTFVACQKEGLVRGIWKNHSHEKTVSTFTAHMIKLQDCKFSYMLKLYRVSRILTVAVSGKLHIALEKTLKRFNNF